MRKPAIITLSAGEKSDCLSKFYEDQAAVLASEFEAPLKDFVRMVKAVKAVMADRSAALSALQMVRPKQRECKSRVHCVGAMHQSTSCPFGTFMFWVLFMAAWGAR